MSQKVTSIIPPAVELVLRVNYGRAKASNLKQLSKEEQYSRVQDDLTRLGVDRSRLPTECDELRVVGEQEFALSWVTSCDSDLHAAITKMSKQWDADADAGSATHGVNKYALSIESISFRELSVRRAPKAQVGEDPYTSYRTTATAAKGSPVFPRTFRNHTERSGNPSWWLEDRSPRARDSGKPYARREPSPWNYRERASSSSMSPSTPRRHYDDHIYLRQSELAELQQDLDDELDRKVEIERRLDELGAGEDLALNVLKLQLLQVSQELKMVRALRWEEQALVSDLKKEMANPVIIPRLIDIIQSLP